MKGLDEADDVLRKTLVFGMVQAASIAAKRGKIKGASK